MVLGLSPLYTLDLRANHYPIYVWKWPFTYWSAVGQVVSLGVFKDACEVRMGLQSSSKKHYVCNLLLPEINLQHSRSKRAFVFFICFLNSYQTALLMNKAFKQEVDSHPWAVNRKIPKGLSDWPGSCLCPSFLPFIVHYPTLFFGCLSSWQGVEMLKNMMIHGPVTSFSAVIFPSGEVEGETGGQVWKRRFCETGFVFMTDCHSGCCWTGCSQCVHPEFTQLLNSLLLSSVCVCVCVR